MFWRATNGNFTGELSAQIYNKTGNLRAVQLFLGHTKLESTVRYLGIEVDDALSTSRSRLSSEPSARPFPPVGPRLGPTVAGGAPKATSRTGTPTRSIGRSAAMRAVPANGEVAVLRQMFADILSLIARLRASPAPA
jgi:hypothetical protein